MESEEQSTQASAPAGAFSRLVGAVVSPRKTFESIAQKPGWWLPVCLIIVVNLILAYGVVQHSHMSAVMQKQFETNPRFSQMTPQQRQHAADIAVRVAYVESYAGALLGTPIVLAILALVFLGAFNIIFGTKIGFGQSFAIGAYAFVPILLKDLLALVMFWAYPPGGGRLRSPSVSSLAAYLPAHSPAWLASVGGKLDVFIFWTIGLLAVGYAAASSKKVRFGGALAVVVVIWLVYVLAAAGLTAGLASMVPRP